MPESPGLQVIAHEERRAILHRQVPAQPFHRVDGTLRGVTDLEIHRLVQLQEFVCALGEKLDAVLDLAEGPSVEQVLHCDGAARV